jgi:glycosyltransferase involved in cell wall biosynthesis
MIKNLPSEKEIISKWKVGDLDNTIVSISCLTYNHEKYIEDALKGFLIQETTYAYQICILDDASTDGNVEIIKEYEKKYPKLFSCFFLKENTWGKPNRREIIKPYYDARNKGKYIALCEGDDYWIDPYKLQKQVDFMEENKEYSMCYHKIIIPNKSLNNKIFYLQNNLSTTFMPTCSILFKNNKILINKLIYHSEKVLSGDQFLFYLCSFIGEVKFMDFIGGVYNQNEHGISSKIGVRSMQWDLNRVYMFAKLIKLAPIHKKKQVLMDAQSSLFNALEHSISKPFLQFKLDAIRILLLGFIFFPKYSLFRIKTYIIRKKV